MFVCDWKGERTVSIRVGDCVRFKKDSGAHNQRNIAAHYSGVYTVVGITYNMAYIKGFDITQPWREGGWYLDRFEKVCVWG